MGDEADHRDPAGGDGDTDPLDEIDEASDESFPASDSPQTWAGEAED